MKNEGIPNKDRNKEKKMGLPATKEPEQFMAAGVMEYLQDALGVTPTMLAGLLQVTERTLLNWRHKSVADLEDNSKSKRLVDLYNFVKQAVDMRVKKNLLLNLLHEPIDPANENSSSVLHYIVHRPSTELLQETAPLIIQNFLKD